MMAQTEMIETLVKAGDAATKAYIAEIELLRKEASKAAMRVNEINSEDVYDLGMVDTLERLKRNTLALSTLLSMSKDAAECISSEIHSICTAYDEREKIYAEKRKELIDREVEYQRKKAAERKEAQP